MAVREEMNVIVKNHEWRTVYKSPSTNSPLQQCILAGYTRMGYNIIIEAPKAQEENDHEDE